MKASVTAAKKVAKASTVRLKSRSRSRGPAGAKGKKGRKSSSEEEEDEGDESDDEEEEERPSHPKVAKRPAAAKARRRDDSPAEVEDELFPSDDEEEEGVPAKAPPKKKKKGATRGPSAPSAPSEWMSPAIHTKLEIQQRMQAIQSGDLLELKVRDRQGSIAGRVLVGVSRFITGTTHDGLGLDALCPIASSGDVQQWINADLSEQGTWPIHLCCSDADACAYQDPHHRRLAHFDVWRLRTPDDLREDDFFMPQFNQTVLKELADKQRLSGDPMRRFPPLPPMKSMPGKDQPEGEVPIIDQRMRSSVSAAVVPHIDPPSLRAGGGRRSEADGTMQKVFDLGGRVQGGESPRHSERDQLISQERKNSSMQGMLADRARVTAEANAPQRLKALPYAPAPASGQRSVFGAPAPQRPAIEDAPEGKERKRKKRHKKNRRRHHSSSTSTSSDSQEDDEAVFHFASSREAGHENAIQDMARRKPGKLLKQGMRLMALHCDPSRTLTGGSDGAKELPPAAMQYLRQVLEATSQVKLGRRDSREMETLATCLDHLVTGRLDTLGDVLIQRFKAVETSTRDQSWLLASQQELIPSKELGVSTARETEAAAKQALQRARLLKHLKG